jgi:hypothetical protein
MMSSGIKASELIVLLQDIMRKHGDREIFSGGADYPAGVRCITVEKIGNGYVPKGAFFIW